MNHYDIVTYECRIKVLKKTIADFESGRKYVKMQETHQKDIANLKKEITELKSALADARINTISVRNQWIEALEELEIQHDKELKKKDIIIKELKKAIIKTQQQRDEALDKLTALRQKYAKLSEDLEESGEKNKKLLAQLNRNYENSSIPSSKAVVHRKIANSREKTDKKPGAQPGHPHHGRTKQTPTEIVKLSAAKEVLEDPDFKKTGKEKVKQLVNISLKIEVKEYHADIYYNSKTNEYYHAPFPKGVVDDVNYDDGIRALLYLLNNDCCVSIDKCSQFLCDLSNGKLKISKGMINKLAKTFSDKSKSDLNEIFKHIQSAPVMHIDFTNANVNGTSAHVGVCATPNGEARYFVRKNKGHKGIKDSIAEDYQGILIHDHDTTFYSYGSNHQECLAHISRYLQDSIDNEKNLTWNSKMKELIKEMVHCRNDVPQGEGLEESQITLFEKKYDEILSIAEKEYIDFPPSKYYREGINLYTRMKEYKDNHLLFLHDMRVPTTNNLSERLLRSYKRKQAQATVFRSFDQIGYLCDGMSMLIMLRQKENVNVFEEVKKIFSR